MAYLIVVIFGAPFLPFLRPYAIATLLFLAVAGNLFVLLVVIVTVCIGVFGKRREELSEEEAS